MDEILLNYFPYINNLFRIFHHKNVFFYPTLWSYSQNHETGSMQTFSLPFVSKSPVPCVKSMKDRQPSISPWYQFRWRQTTSVLYSRVQNESPQYSHNKSEGDERKYMSDCGVPIASNTATVKTSGPFTWTSHNAFMSRNLYSPFFHYYYYDYYTRTEGLSIFCFTSSSTYFPPLHPP